MNAFIAELRRRKVVRVAAAYLVAAWVIMQVVNVATPALDLPPWFDGAVFLLLAAGFVIALVVSWVFELTPEGLKRTAPAGVGDAPAQLARTDLVLIVAVVALIGATLFQAARPGAGPVARPASGDDLSVAVLPFVNMSSDPEQEYFSDGLSEELLNVLAQIRELRVAGRTSSFAFKGRNEDLREIGEQLGVAHVLEGSVRKSGDRLRITAQLVSVADGYHLWSDTYDRQLTDVFAVQEEIAMAVAEAMSVTLGLQDAPSAPAATDNLELYDLYLQGLALARDAQDPTNLLRAVDILRGVLAADPDFARARVALAEAYVPIIVFFPERTERSVAELEDVVAEALARAPDDPASHYVNAILQHLRQDWLAADAAYARSENAQGGAIGGRAYRSMRLLQVGHAADAAERLFDEASRDPLAADPSLYLQQSLTALGRYEEAEVEYRRASDLRLSVAPNEHMALIRVWNGDDDALIRERFDRYIAAQPVESALDAAVREVYDDPAAALALVRSAADSPDMNDATRQLFIAIYASHYGDPDLAVAALRRALFEMKGPFSQGLWYPDMAAARRTPAFKDLVRDLGLVELWRTTGKWGDFCRPVGDDDFACE